MNIRQEYENKINWDIWADVVAIVNDFPVSVDEIQCSYEGGELGSTGRDKFSGELSDDCVIGQNSKCKR